MTTALLVSAAADGAPEQEGFGPKELWHLLPRHRIVITRRLTRRLDA